MNSNPNFIEIKTETTKLLDPEITQENAKISLDKIHLKLQETTAITGSDFSIENLAAIPTSKGKALGLNYAALCLLDYKRTTLFLQAIYTAIKELQDKKPKKKIKIFYAGCGPYAPFFTLICTLFKQSEIEFSLLDINIASINSTKKIIHAFNLFPYISSIYTADATTIKVPKSVCYNILISETLDAVLYRECYVPILMNLLPQFKKDVILIPENVLLTSSLINTDEPDKEEELLNVIFDVRNSILNNTISDNFNPLKVAISKKTEHYNTLVIDTNVHIYKDYWLKRYDSTLTTPYAYHLEKPFTKQKAVFTYHLDPEIEMKLTFE